MQVVNLLKYLPTNADTQIAKLLAQLGYPQDLELFKERLECFVKLPGYGVAIASENEIIVGLVAWSKSMCLVNNKTRVRIEALVVDSEHRQKGVGEKLMNFVEDFAMQFSPCIIELTSGAKRRADGSHDFYDKIGYKNVGDAEKIYLRKEV